MPLENIGRCRRCPKLQTEPFINTHAPGEINTLENTTCPEKETVRAVGLDWTVQKMPKTAEAFINTDSL